MDYQRIYDHHAGDYDALVSAEDCDGNLLPALRSLCPLDGAAVLEVGIGTGRIARQLVAGARRLVGVDRAAAMLEVARRHLAASGAGGWELHQADARALPVADAWADVAIAGWVFGHLRSWLPERWREEIGQGLGEMRRALSPGGTLIVIETLGTGHEAPAPAPHLAEYYEWLEEVQGLRRLVIRTDYQFPDVSTAAAVTGSFFGEEFAARVQRERWSRVPECTGLWWRRGAG